MLMHQLCLITICVFFGLIVFRHLFLKKILPYHTILFFISVVLVIGGGGVQNDRYARLERFIELENNQQIEYAQKHRGEYDSMLRIDLE